MCGAWNWITTRGKISCKRGDLCAGAPVYNRALCLRRSRLWAMRQRQRPQQAEKGKITTFVDRVSPLLHGSTDFLGLGPTAAYFGPGVIMSRDSPASGAGSICTSPADAHSVPRVDRSSKGENTLAPKQTTRSDWGFHVSLFFGLVLSINALFLFHSLHSLHSLHSHRSCNAANHNRLNIQTTPKKLKRHYLIEANAQKQRPENFA